jgi:hypothetical protein
VADQVWPPALPQSPRLTDLHESPPYVVVRTAMDAGPAKIRRRFTAGYTTRSMSMPRSGKTLLYFFLGTVKGGALPFDWRNPITLAPATAANSCMSADAPSIHGATVNARTFGPAASVAGPAPHAHSAKGRRYRSGGLRRGFGAAAVQLLDGLEKLLGCGSRSHARVLGGPDASAPDLETRGSSARREAPGRLAMAAHPEAIVTPRRGFLDPQRGSTARVRRGSSGSDHADIAAETARVPVIAPSDGVCGIGRHASSRLPCV